MKSNLVIYGCCKFSALEISYALFDLNVSHTRLIGKGKKFVDRHKAQPKSVVVTDSWKSLDASSINFISAPLADLGLTNVPLIAGPLPDSLKQALLEAKSTKVIRQQPQFLDYVNMVAKPSVLNKLQTEIYKVNPYKLRQETQSIMLDYFNSRISKHQLKQLLTKSLRQESLLPLFKEAEPLRVAVAMLSRNTPEQVEALTGIPTFELLYISKERK